MAPCSSSRLFFYILLASVDIAADSSAKIVRGLDGETLEILHYHQAERIRLSGIDCPEKGQAYGKRAKQASSALAFSKEVTVKTHGHDKYGHTLADVLLPDGNNVNHTLVKDGWWWWCRKYASGNTVVERLELEALEAKTGPWSEPESVPPWGWRKR